MLPESSWGSSVDLDERPLELLLLFLNIFIFGPTEGLKEWYSEHPFTFYVDLLAVNILPHFGLSIDPPKYFFLRVGSKLHHSNPSCL